MTMLGRTYTIGYETDLERVLINRPIERVTNPDWPWAVWYPLRRAGPFEQLSTKEQRTILMEHGGIGRAYGEADFAHDVRLACHGLGTEDNDFIAGLVGKELYPLSQIVQRMRKTKQTSLYLEKLGPFFIGKAIWQNSKQ
jgi:chlorite dismutase